MRSGKFTAAWVLRATVLLAGCPAPEGSAPALAPDAAMPEEAPHPDFGATTSSTVARYRLRIPAPSTHRVEIDAVFPTRGRGELEIWMPTWTPGSYLIREFSRQVDRVEAWDPGGRPLQVTKVAKNRWRIDALGAPAVRLRYAVYAREASVRTSYVDPELGILNGASVFVTSDPTLPCELTVDAPPSWAELATALDPDPSGRQRRYLADSFDALVDAPILGGVFARQSFEVQGVPIRLAHHGAEGALDLARAAPALEAIVLEAAAVFQTIPFRAHLTLSVFGDQPGGGLEHKDSAVLIASRLGPRTEEGHRRWLTLYAHELFHAWNGKRLRPVALGPFDYEHEAYTEGLWFVEGFTSYYDELLVARAGALSASDYLKDLSTAVQALESTPGRQVQSLDESSFDAWIKFYRPDDGSAATTVSYYGKGALLGFVLDARIQEVTRGAADLDRVMRAAFERFSGPRGYSTDELLAVVAEVAGQGTAAWLADATARPGELELEPALRWYGLRRKPNEPPPPNETPAALRERRRKLSWLGVETVAKNGRLEISRVRRDGPGQQAGLQVEDELLAVDGLRLTEVSLDARLELYLPGDTVEILLARRGRIDRVSATIQEKPAPVVIEVDPGATRGARDHFTHLLEGRRINRR